MVPLLLALTRRTKYATIIDGKRFSPIEFRELAGDQHHTSHIPFQVLPTLLMIG